MTLMELWTLDHSQTVDLMALTGAIILAGAAVAGICRRRGWLTFLTSGEDGSKEGGKGK